MVAQQTQTLSAPFVEFRDISKTYDGASNVVDGLSLSIQRGEFVTLLGPSGSGKTTLLMMLAGFENPTGGEIHLAGKRLDRTPAYKRNMGVVFQSYALFPHMTVAQNIAYPLKQRRIPKGDIDRRVETALEKVHMGKFASRLPTQLSGGQQQRIALARALVSEPDVVLMDEPLGALDKQLREHMQIEIKRLHEELGMTVVYVTHDQSEALTMSNRIAVFNRGTILQIGTPQEIYEEPNCSFVGNFIGEINNFHGKVTAVEGAFARVRLSCGTEVQGLNVLNAVIGQTVNLAVRPERLALAADGQGGPGAVRGVVRTLIYHGDHLRYEVEVAGCKGITARSSLERTDRFEPGTAIDLSWPRERARVLDREEGK
ncbi:ABC transporter ATP-binding protein [Gemmobacter fulvus]|uniref:ABC transporter ATP-binding protein n=1 Tax=Gemmobacter fulvus TaxID=2840474 RepID=UPI002796D815|nr:ABC transporter ATP-binding protein [Gemmobacter fulvus]MDQ1850465.1 ABC transporter ATP-binding protein [Gemmobacter fulvus]